MICMKCLATAPDEFEKCPKCGATLKLNKQAQSDFNQVLGLVSNFEEILSKLKE